ncbi:PTS sugar transporter subunit IIA [bacterium]|nr:PTS sugar transporter subunit IIA [bacterium]
MRLTELLDISLVESHLVVDSKEDAIRYLIDIVAAKNLILDRDKALQAVIERERSLSTGLGEGIAIPHAMLSEISKPVVALGRVVDGINFGAPDEKPAFLIFLLLSPSQDLSLHLKMLSRISRLCNNPDLRQAILAASDSKAIFQLLQEQEDIMQDF